MKNKQRTENKLKEVLSDPNKRKAIRKKLIQDSIKNNYEALKKLED